ncbi:alkaline phosphatase family protein [Gammaproteobacteria bacterium]|nr:alkaline phosphatase family protein [Gammaproteobacteria bacterium]
MLGDNNNFVFIVLDALRSDHVNEEYMPFLHSLKTNSIFIEKLNVSSGFCERAEIFFGQYPYESGFVHAIAPDAKIKPYAWLPERIAKILSIFESHLILKKILRRILWRCSIMLGNGMYPQRIPLAVLPKFGFTEDSVNFEDYCLKIRKGLLYTIISLGFKVNWKYFTSLSSSLHFSDSQRLQGVLKQVSLSRNQFLPVYIGSPDEYGHKFGPHSNGLITKLIALDNEIKEFYISCKKSDPSVKICFVGDHGMEEVTNVLDLQTEIVLLANKFGVIEGQDYGIFADSTSIRFWFYIKSNAVESFISAIVNNKLLLEFGRFLDDELCEKENLPPVTKIADLVWWASKGTQVAPDYFHDEPKGKLGMHGYLKVDGISSGFLLCNSINGPHVHFKTCECHELNDVLL